MKSIEVNVAQMPKKWAEYAPKNVWPNLKGDDALELFLPTEDLDRGHFNDRTFFWTIIRTIRPDWCR